MNFHTLWDMMGYALRNETDGFAATVIEPRESKLPVYIIFNCYGSFGWRLLTPRKHRRMIVEIALDNGGGKRYKRFNWNEMIPIKVSDSPRLLMRGKQCKRALSLLPRHEWESIFDFIRRNQQTIRRHWIGESSSHELFKELKLWR